MKLYRKQKLSPSNGGSMKVTNNQTQLLLYRRCYETLQNKITPKWRKPKQTMNLNESKLWLWFKKLYKQKISLKEERSTSKDKDNTTMRHLVGLEWQTLNRLLRHTGTRQGRRRLFEYTRSHGEQVETLWNQGRQSDTWHKRKGKIPETRGKLIFQNKTGIDETKHYSKCHWVLTATRRSIITFTRFTFLCNNVLWIPTQNLLKRFVCVNGHSSFSNVRKKKREI